MRSTSRRLRHLARDLKADPSVISAGRDPDDHDTLDIEAFLTRLEAKAAFDRPSPSITAA